MRLPLFSRRSARQPLPGRVRLAMESLERREMLHGDEVLPTLVIETNFGDIPMEMLENNAPGTVDNFLNYVEDSDFINSIFHRSVPGFVLQGGGFRSSAAQICNVTQCQPADVNTSLFDSVPTDPPIVNEFDVSNVRGTVAMAKTAVSPDTATSQFFVNLEDNSGPPASLDTQNGGFSVFARVTDMTAVDEIAAMNTINLSSQFSPPLSAIVAAPIDGNEIVRVEGFGGTGVIHGTVFLDINGDSLLRAGEGGIANRIVYVDENNDGQRDSREETAFTNDSGEYHLRVPEGANTIRLELPDQFDLTLNSDRYIVDLEVGRSARHRNFGLRYTGTDWTNPLNEVDIDAVNGVTPRDVLLIINELELREVSNRQDGMLPPKNTSPNDPTFFDVDGNQFVAARDAVIVINNLPGNVQLNGPRGASESAVEAATIELAPLSAGAAALRLAPATLQQSAELSQVRGDVQPVAWVSTALSDSIVSSRTGETPQRSADAVFEDWP